MSDTCAGVTLQGERRGQPCGAPPKYMAKGKFYCAAHYVVALKSPKRFRAAVEYLVRFDARQIMKQREAERVAKVQIDAFPDAPLSFTGTPMVLVDDSNFNAHGMHSDTP